jgi:transposase
VGLADQVRQLQGQNAELQAEVGKPRAENAELRAKLEALEAELEKLKREVGRNSSNSGKPPSSDSLAERAKQTEDRLSRAERRRLAREKAKKFLNERVKRRPGKQPGAAGAALARAGAPDRVVVRAPLNCARCGESLGTAEVIGTEVRQVFDVPVRRLEVTEHRAESRRCR